MTQIDGIQKVDVPALAAKVKKMRDDGKLQLPSKLRESLDIVLDGIAKGAVYRETSQGVSLLLMCADGIYS